MRCQRAVSIFFVIKVNIKYFSHSICKYYLLFILIICISSQNDFFLYLNGKRSYKRCVSFSVNSICFGRLILFWTTLEISNFSSHVDYYGRILLSVWKGCHLAHIINNIIISRTNVYSYVHLERNIMWLFVNN